MADKCPWCKSDLKRKHSTHNEFICGSTSDWGGVFVKSESCQLIHQIAEIQNVRDSAWPPRDIVTKLVEAATTLYHDYDYDREGHGAMQTVIDVAKKWIDQPDSVRDRVLSDLFNYVKSLGHEQESSTMLSCKDPGGKPYVVIVMSREAYERRAWPIQSLGIQL